MRERNPYTRSRISFSEPVSDSKSAECILAGNSLILGASLFAEVGRSNQNSNCVNFLRKSEYYQNKSLRQLDQMLIVNHVVFLNARMVDNVIQCNSRV